MKYPLAFGFLATCTAILGFQLGGFAGAMLGWLALAWYIVAGSYLFNSPTLLGKRNGRMTFASLVVMPHLFIGAVLWHVLRLLERSPPYQRLTPQLLIGRRLLRGEMPEGVRSVVDLTSEFWEHSWGDRRVLHVPILDASSPSSELLRETAKAIAELPAPVYIHCAQGYGRTATIAAACLVVNGGISLPEALSAIIESRPGARPNSNQRKVLARLSDTFHDPD